jgi:hypothetical protein
MHRLSGHPVALSHVGHGGQTRLLCASTLHPEFRWGRHLTVVMVSLGVFRERYWDRGMLFRRSESAVRIVAISFLVPITPQHCSGGLAYSPPAPAAPLAQPGKVWTDPDPTVSDFIG